MGLRRCASMRHTNMKILAQLPKRCPEEVFEQPRKKIPDIGPFCGAVDREVCQASVSHRLLFLNGMSRIRLRGHLASTGR